MYCHRGGQHTCLTPLNIHVPNRGENLTFIRSITSNMELIVHSNFISSILSFSSPNVASRTYTTARPPYRKFLGSKIERWGRGPVVGSSVWKRRNKLEGCCPPTTPILFLCMPETFPASIPKNDQRNLDGGGGGGRHPERQTPTHTTVGAKPILRYCAMPRHHLGHATSGTLSF